MSSENKEIAAGPSYLRQFLAGGVGGCCLVVVGQPFDTIKVRMQVGNYKSIGECLKKTLAEGKFGAPLFRGMSAPLAGVPFMYGLCFLGYGIGKTIFCDEDAFKEMKLLQIGMAGATSALFTTPIIAPGERIKCVLQTQVASAAAYGGPMDVVKDLYKKGGLRHVMRGMGVTCMRDAAGSMFYFSGYEYLKRQFIPEGASKQRVVGGTLCAGGCAGILNWLACLPLDTIKTRLQTDLDGKYRGAAHVLTDLIKKEGPGALWKGIWPTLLRAFPANAAMFLGMECASRLLGHLGMK